MGPFLLSDQQRTKVQRVERITELVSEGPLEVSGPASYSVQSWLKICSRFLRTSPFKF